MTKCIILRKAAFSLIEVVIATAVFATAIVAIIGLMAPLSQRVEDVIDSEIAARLADNIQVELNRIGFAAVGSVIVAPAPVYLYALPDGSRVLRGPAPDVEPSATTFEVNFNLQTGVPAGIAKRDRYFLVTLEDARINGVAFNNTTSGSVALRTTIEWPYRIPTGPATDFLTSGGSAAYDGSRLAAADQRRRLVLFFALTP